MRIRPQLLALLLALALGAAASAPVPAQAAPPAQDAGKARLVLGKPAQKQLAKRGVKLRGAGAALRGGRRLVLPVRSGSVGSSVARVRHAGAIVLRSGRRKARLRQLRLTVVAGAANLTARLGRYRYTVSRLRGVDEVPFNPIAGLVRFSGAQVRLTAEMRRLLRKRLGGKRLPRVLGRLRIRARVAIAPPDTAEPDPLPRPGTAVDAESVRIEWRVRESFICYMHSGGGPGVSVDGGVGEVRESYPPAHMHPGAECAGQPSGPLPYTFEYPSETASGWYDSDSGTAVLRAEGTVRFDLDARGLHVEMRAPEVELAGADSRLIHTYIEGGEQRRGVTADLDLDAAEWQVEREAGEEIHTLLRVPGYVPDGPTRGRFAGFYHRGEPFGWVTVEFIVPVEAALLEEEWG